MLAAGPYQSVMIITACVGLDQWLLMVTFRPDPSPGPTGADKYYAKHGTGQTVVETAICSRDISSSRATLKSWSLSKFSGLKINVFPITRGPGWPGCLLS